MPVDDQRRSPMMSHLLDALERGEDIGHYGRLTFAMVARHFMDTEDLVRLLTQGGDTDERKARALVKQVEDHDYNPPRRERILKWQAKQGFPICPNPDDPDACNVYKELDLLERVFEHIEEYREQQV
jgi:DNA primase large subunit